MTTVIAHSDTVPRCKRVSRIPRRAHARRSWLDVRLCIAKIVFSPTDVRYATRAGGVSPPWVRYRDCTNACEHTDGSLPRLCGSVPACTFFNPHGGLMPAALVSARDECPRTSAVSVLQLRLPNAHGGLTPAALGEGLKVVGANLENRGGWRAVCSASAGRPVCLTGFAEAGRIAQQGPNRGILQFPGHG
jgi:hypothetical protein